MMTVKEVAGLTGVSARTLQYYDKINLLAPAEYTPSGYRLYDTESLLKLQQILLYKELGFSLKEIKQFMNDPVSDKKTRLQEQKTMLKQKKENVEAMIAQVDSLLKEEKTMDFEVFKSTLATKMPSNAPQEQKDKALEMFTPEMFEAIQQSWGAKEFLDLPVHTTEELKGYLQHCQDIINQIIAETNQAKIVQLVEEWMQISILFAYLEDEKFFLAQMISAYQSNPKIVEDFDKTHGDGAREKVLHALQAYAESAV